MRKYPRTPHLAGSLGQYGDSPERVPFEAVKGKRLVLEEKIDGANCGISFTPQGQLLLQSRGHYLAGGPREKHWTLFKQWAHTIGPRLWPALGDRYVMFGEWMHSKHTVFYDALQHYFMEFDVLDKSNEIFLSTAARRALLDGLPIKSVVVLRDGIFDSMGEITSLVGKSRHASEAVGEHFRIACARAGLDYEKAKEESEFSGVMEGLYIKEEDEQRVLSRYKFVRSQFLQTIIDSDEHWLNRPIVENMLAKDVNIFSWE
jgi:hypothetical protein